MGTWKAIGSSVLGAGHVATGKPCEDAVKYSIVHGKDNEETLVCCVSDGAGSAQYAVFASTLCVGRVAAALEGSAIDGEEVGEEAIFALLEEVYDELANEAVAQDVEINEFSCTLLGCYITAQRGVFFQVGDGAIIRNDASGFYIPVWMPQNGEYQNSTTFLIDDKNMGHVKISIVEEPITEVGLFTDGLQMLALNMEAENVHQPFFAPLFKYLRLAGDAAKVGVLQSKLEAYLDSTQINERTDDDKTLFLATRE